MTIPEKKQLIQAGISVVLLISCLVLIFGGFADDCKKWAFGMIGIIVGYWLK
jgi:hypothetical protein